MTRTGHTSTQSNQGNTALDLNPIPHPGSPRLEEPIDRSEEFDARVEEVRRLYGGSGGHLLDPLVESVRRRLGLAPRSSGAKALAGSVGLVLRLALALLGTALIGDWAGVPWGRWAIILAFYGWFHAMRATWTLDVEPQPWVRQLGENMTPLLPTIMRESDLQDLAALIRRWSRPWLLLASGVTVATTVLAACWLFEPTALSELPPGTVALMALLLYDFGALMVYGALFEWVFMAHHARYDHDLFWPSPADTPEIRMAMRMWNVRMLAIWITVFLVLALVLVPWDSPVIVPLAVGYIVIGYLTTIGAALGDRAGVRRIVERARQQQLEELRARIAPFKSRFADLSTQEFEQLKELLFLHDRIRDAPASPSATHTVLRAGTGLIAPTIVFIITVFGEVSAERFLDAILP